MPLQLTGEAKQGDLILYAKLPAHLSGPLMTPMLAFQPGALLRSRGRVIDALNIDDVRWPLAGGEDLDPRNRWAITGDSARHEQQTGDFVLHLDGQADNFMPDKRYLAVAILGRRTLHADASSLGRYGNR
ncbi:Uncharacterised protein [Kluyvera cryocrescens]|uniref:Uncharacterized protein n=1 Tax=Kluyvera cryocrescens TaxID=580 RepID=A0A485A1I5_KLUCR|nr:Uncharacterised protein [Kluyvera cryocrescens]